MIMTTNDQHGVLDHRFHHRIPEIITAGSPGQHIILAILVPFAWFHLHQGFGPNRHSQIRFSYQDAIPLIDPSRVIDLLSAPGSANYQDCLPSFLLTVQTRISCFAISILHILVSRLSPCQKNTTTTVVQQTSAHNTNLSAKYLNTSFISVSLSTFIHSVCARYRSPYPTYIKVSMKKGQQWATVLRFLSFPPSPYPYPCQSAPTPLHIGLR